MKSDTTDALLEVLKELAVCYQTLTRKVYAAESVILDDTLDHPKEWGHALYQKYLRKVNELAEDSDISDESLERIPKAIEALRVKLLRDRS
jgi:hypothetical protein